MSEKYISVNLDDPRSDTIAEVITNKTCRKILNFIAEREMSEGDIAKELSIPANTVNYNIKKLSDAGLIEKSKNFFWSVKGKKINTYRLSNKKIVIFPRTITKGIIPAILISGLIAIGIKIYASAAVTVQKFGSVAFQSGQSDLSQGASAPAAMEAARTAAQTETATQQIYTILTSTNSWLWFLLGSLTAILIFLVWRLITDR